MTRLFAGTPFDRPPRCDRCDRPLEECRCGPEPAPAVPPDQQTLRVTLEKRKQGRWATVVRGLAAQPGPMQELLTVLKTKCGAGGTIADEGQLEIQGDHVERVRSTLQGLGYRLKRS